MKLMTDRTQSRMMHHEEHEEHEEKEVRRLRGLRVLRGKKGMNGEPRAGVYRLAPAALPCRSARR
jgi:hypothetical protein